MRNLRTEDEIIANWKGDIEKPVVSICCITYNHEPYIEDALEGFLIQETDFPFEILIHDDASTDRTAEIIREYEAKYPRLIKPIYQTENQFIKDLHLPFKNTFTQAGGEYIALCEGDDYWISPKKLKKQYDFLRENEEYSLCFHSAEIKVEKGHNEFTFLGEKLENRRYSGSEILETWTIPTASVFFKLNTDIKQKLIKNLSNSQIVYGDIVIFLTLAEFGGLYSLKDKMSVYRKHPGGMLAQSYNQKKIEALINHYTEIDKIFNYKYSKIISKIISKIRCLLYANIAILNFNTNKIKSIKFILKSFNQNRLLFLTKLFKTLIKK